MWRTLFSESLGISASDCGTDPCSPPRSHIFLSTGRENSRSGLTPIFISSNWWAHLDSTQGPTGYEPVALPAELWALCLHLQDNDFNTIQRYLSPGVLFIYGPQSSLSREISPRLLSPRRRPASIPFSQLQRCHQLSIKLLSFLRRLGCRSFLRALASICRIRSLVTRKSWPTSSRV